VSPVGSYSVSPVGSYSVSHVGSYSVSPVGSFSVSDQHKTAIELELTNKSSVFQKQIDEQHAVADAFTSSQFAQLILV
jgi:hypothetical protein